MQRQVTTRSRETRKPSLDEPNSISQTLKSAPLPPQNRLPYTKNIRVIHSGKTQRPTMIIISVPILW
ncbi:hypothetical protein VTJ04DRAFT_1426 [Mycothermus thermophilus]|uniref:uncharacterized protein n=1 Tax=Humicola insolens TaxID=85995 RepID=UPI0037445F5D